MDLFRRVISRINAQLSDLTASQRLAIGLCVVVIVGSFMWLVRWSAEPEYVRLLEEPMTTEQLAAARKALPAGKSRIHGGNIYVPAADRHEMFWQLQDADALPADTHITFEKLIEDDSPFRPESENSFRRRVALQNELAQVIASSRAVQSADVFITDVSDRRINAPNTLPTASITVINAPGHTLDRNMVTACAEIVAGAVPGLMPHNVSVIDGTTMQPFKVPDPKDAIAQGLLAEVKKKENHITQKIERQLSYIPGVRVSVSVDLDAARRHTKKYEYAKPEVSEETTSLNESKSGLPSGEPGVGPNVGQSLAAGTAGEVDTKEETTTVFQDQRMIGETTTQEFPFGLKRATATIGIPRSYIIGVIQTQRGTQDEPSEEDIGAQLSVVRAGVRDTVKTIIMSNKDEDVTVDVFLDVTPLPFRADGTPVLATGLSTTNQAVDLLKEYGPEGGLALMAVVGMLMMMRMAHKSARGAAQRYGQQSFAARSAKETAEEQLDVAAGAVGLAEPTLGSALEGREVDESSLRGDEMTRQVVQLVQEDPEGVARLLRRWTDANM